MSEQFNRVWQAVQELRETEKRALMLFLIGAYLRNETEYVSFTDDTIPVCFVGILADSQRGVDMLLQIEDFLENHYDFPLANQESAIVQLDSLLAKYLASGDPEEAE